RAFMRDARILLLDEPTSALDAQAEYDLFERLKSLTRGRTAVYISHRFSTVRRADRILFLEHGRLVEQGTHQQLMRLDGRYARLRLAEIEAGDHRLHVVLFRDDVAADRRREAGGRTRLLRQPVDRPLRRGARGHGGRGDVQADPGAGQVERRPQVPRVVPGRDQHPAVGGEDGGPRHLALAGHLRHVNGVGAGEDVGRDAVLDLGDQHLGTGEAEANGQAGVRLLEPMADPGEGAGQRRG